MNGEYVRICEQNVVAYFKIVSHHTSRQTEKIKTLGQYCRNCWRDSNHVLSKQKSSVVCNINKWGLLFNQNNYVYDRLLEWLIFASMSVYLLMTN